KIMKVLTTMDLGLSLSFLVPLCVTMSTTKKEWVLGHLGCVLTGILENSFTFGHSLIMLALTVESSERQFERNSVKCKEPTLSITVLASTFPLLGHNTLYVFVKDFQHCVLVANKLATLLNFLLYTLPHAAVLLLWIIIVKTLHCKSNRVSSTMQSQQQQCSTVWSAPAGPDSRRMSSFITMTSESRHISKFSMIQIPLAFLHISNATSYFLYSKFPFPSTSMASLLLLASAVALQPILLFSVSSALRRAFKNAMKLNNVPNTSQPTAFRTNGQSVLPREELREDLPDFLKRNGSGMTIKVRVVSSPDTDSHIQETQDFEVAVPIRVDKGYNSMPTTPTNRTVKYENISPRKSASESSGDSLNANAETRSSVSSFSGFTLNVSDLGTRPLARIRINSELVYDPPSPTSSTASDPIGNQRRLSLPSKSRHNSLSSPKLRKGRQFKTVLPDKSKLILQPVEDLSSADSTPRVSSNTNEYAKDGKDRKQKIEDSNKEEKQKSENIKKTEEKDKTDNGKKSVESKE
ncbi:hypothetical protein FSP39_021582, partial [Pinctada imbricata]